MVAALPLARLVGCAFALLTLLSNGSLKEMKDMRGGDQPQGGGET
jgi:hypothetical protein